MSATTILATASDVIIIILLYTFVQLVFFGRLCISKQERNAKRVPKFPLVGMNYEQSDFTIKRNTVRLYFHRPYKRKYQRSIVTF